MKNHAHSTQFFYRLFIVIGLMVLIFSTIKFDNTSTVHAQEGATATPAAEDVTPPIITESPDESEPAMSDEEGEVQPSTQPQKRGNPSVSQSDNQQIPTNRIIVKFTDVSDAFSIDVQEQEGKMTMLSSETGMPMRYFRDMSDGAHVLQLPERLPLEQVWEISRQIMSMPDVEYAEPDQIMQHTLTPNDPRYSDQWHYYSTYGINLPAAWDITTGSSSVVVAVLDTGITSHSEFSGRVVQGYDFISDVWMANDGNGRDSDPSDPGDWVNANDCYLGSLAKNSSWHGTHVAGTIAANSNNGLGVAGVDWNTRILPVRVLGRCGGYLSDIADGIRWAAGLSVSGVPANSNPAKVINMSLSGYGSCGTAYQNAINAATAAGSTVVVAAGNSNWNASDFRPANCNGVITVGATDFDGWIAGYSNYGSTLEISAPGGDFFWDPGILSTLNTGTTVPVADTYAYYQGTSMAAPHVSGVVSLMLSVTPTLTPDQVLQILQNTARSFGQSWCNTTNNCGAGIVDAAAAVKAAQFYNWYGSASITSSQSVVAVGRPHVGAEVASYNGIASGSLTSYVPMLFKSAFGGSYNSALYVQNLHTTNTANIAIKYYTTSGVLSCTVNDTVSPLSSKGYWLPSVGCLPAGWVGGVEVTSNQPIVAVGRPHVGNEIMTYNGFSSGSTTSYIPMLFKNAFGGSYNAAFYIQNIHASNTANITIKYYDNAGNLNCTVNDTVSPLASKGYWLPSVGCLANGWVGGVHVTSSQPIVTVGRPHIGDQVTTYSGFSSGSTTSYIPMLFKNAFGGSYNAAFYIQNVHASNTANVTIKYYDSAGNLNCTVNDTVSPLASKGYWLPNIGCLSNGWVGGVQVTSDQPIVTVGRPHIGTQITTYPGFTGGGLNMYLPMLFKDAFGGSYDSAFYVQNTHASNTASVTVNFYDTNGNLSCIRSDSIPPLATKGYWLPSLSCDP